MDQDICLSDLIQGTLESLDQLGGKFPDESDRIA